jgi:hypothetical protein
MMKTACNWAFTNFDHGLHVSTAEFLGVLDKRRVTASR